MAVLLLLCIPLIFFSYAFQLEEKNKHIFLFFVGSAATTLFLLIVSFFSAKTDRYIGSLGSYFFYSFFSLFQQLFLASTHLRIMPIVLCIILYASALFILDALLHFCTDITFYYTVACTLCFLLFIGILILGTFALGLHYFKGNPIIYGSILAGIALIGTVLHFILYRQGNAG